MNPFAGRQVSPYANSVECFQLATHWIQSCLTDHEHCRRVVCPYEWDYESEDDRCDAESSHSDSEMLSNSDDSNSPNADNSYPSKKRRLNASNNETDTNSVSDYLDQGCVRSIIEKLKDEEERFLKDPDLKSPLFREEQFREMVIKRPASLAEMQLISSFNTDNVEKYGDHFLLVIRVLQTLIKMEGFIPDDTKLQPSSESLEKRSSLSQGILTRKMPILRSGAATRNGYVRVGLAWVKDDVTSDSPLCILKELKEKK